MSCEDQGFSRIEDGCNVWPCQKVPLVQGPNHLGRGNYWKCPKCGGYYGEVVTERNGKGRS